MRFFISILLAGGIAAAPLSAQSLKSDEIMSSLAVHGLSEIHPVVGSDNRVHLAYELMISNPSPLFVTIDRIEAIDPGGKVLGTLSGDGLAKLTTRFSGSDNLIAPGQSAIVYMDVTFAPADVLPQTVLARVNLTRQGNVDGKPAPFPAGAPIPASTTFTGAPLKVGAAARRIAAPLRGPGWVAMNGCCDAITTHRRAVIAVNGKQNAPERFAIDWIQLNKDRKMFSGIGKKLTDFSFYGAPIHAVADGTVVNAYDDADEQVPLEPAKGLIPANIGGNMLVVDIGGGAYAFYAHFQRGSMKAKMGDKVKTGQVLGLLGNTGNSDAPHLHFHLMDGTSPLNANGLPFVIDRFTSEGVMPQSQVDPMFEGAAVTIEPRFKGQHVDQLPLNNVVSDFGE